MALTQRLEIRQGQSLVMTPQLQQAIKLLQLVELELADYASRSWRRIRCSSATKPSPPEPKSAVARRDAGEPKPLEAALAREDFSKGEDMDTARERSLRRRRRPPAAAGPQPAADRLDDGQSPAIRSKATKTRLNRPLPQGGSLKDHLTDQLAIAALDAGQAADLRGADRCHRRGGLSARRSRRIRRRAWARNSTMSRRC